MSSATTTTSSFGTINQLIASNSNTISYAATILITLSIVLYFYLRHVYSFFERLGLKNPPAYPFVGNLATILFSDRMQVVQKWTRKYGKFYGVFHGTKPRFVVADAELLRQICIKDFDIMPNHEKSDLLNDFQKHFLFFMQDDHWKRVRAMQSPTFTSGKIKRMFLLLEKCGQDLVKCFEEQFETTKPSSSSSGSSSQMSPIVNLKDIYSLYTLDCIASAAYSMKLERKGSSSIESASSRNDFVRMAALLFKTNISRLIISTALPKSLLKTFGFTTSPRSKLEALAEKVGHIINTRRMSGKKFDDYLQLLIEAKLDDKLELNDLDDKENHHAGLTSESLQADQAKMLSDIGRRRAINGQHETNGNMNGNQQQQQQHTSTTKFARVKLDDDEIVSSAIFLLVVGLETTATLLTNCTYALAFHQDIQERLYQTIKSLAKLDHASGEYSFDYESLTSSPYLDAVISETLRALSPVIEVDRVVAQDYFIPKYNVTVKKGEKLLLGYHAIMNNSEYFPEPQRFDPDRFMPENRDKIVPGSYCPFGLGPRHCIGMRFSLTETKCALARVLMKFKFNPAPNTSYPPTSNKTVVLNNMANPIVELRLR